MKKVHPVDTLDGDTRRDKICVSDLRYGHYEPTSRRQDDPVGVLQQSRQCRQEAACRQRREVLQHRR